MPTRNVNLTDGLDSFVAYQLESGRYENASEVVRDGLRMLVRTERRHLAKLAAIRAGTKEGEARSIAGKPNV
jgi:antitoxin ParD1/3/4